MAAVDQLTTLDAGFLKAEDADRHVSLAIGGLAVIEGPIPDRDELMTTLALRIRACPRFGQRLRTRPFDLGAPEWVDDPNFDLGRHVRHVALPRPGGDRELFQLAADVISRRLDRDRPLWEIWIIEGLSDNRWAMLTKIHHCMADGIAATHMLAGLCDDGIGESYASHIRAIKEPEAQGVSRSRPGLNPFNMLGGLWNASTAITATAARTALGAAEIAVGLLRPTTTSLNGPITTLRRYGVARVPLADIAQVCQTFDVTINDVALAAITESYRNILVQRGEAPLPDALRALVPVSMRSVDALDKTDNRVSVMLPYLPVDEEHPIERLRTVHSRLDRTKSHGQRQAGHAFVVVGQSHSISPDRVGGPVIDPAAAAWRHHPGNECSGAPSAVAAHGATGAQRVPGPADCDAIANRSGHAELCRGPVLRRPRRLRGGGRHRRTGPRNRAGGGPPGGDQ
ncbi:Acyltransferase, ws/dgat/mgat subfamily protein [Mycobacterium intracellulare subsp. intracellulare MTCC 9506]|uniref:Diacylglycerol O-acyltransferase n=1 Tax=Mycobacterium indicus pranii (strain DSM 45239 / MTCC 9506) TaxID=1232724 RepID=J9WCK9_MYCIP|nr:Acyltransferase, ws/dgat/mgat subfamily protein [Mycobacterium intracellulare subsp. intracellulare MTCC 9506]